MIDLPPPDSYIQDAATWRDVAASRRPAMSRRGTLDRHPLRTREGQEVCRLLTEHARLGTAEIVRRLGMEDRYSTARTLLMRMELYGLIVGQPCDVARRPSQAARADHRQGASGWQRVILWRLR